MARTGPGLSELYHLRDVSSSAHNCIVDYSGFFRDEDGPHVYTDIHRFATEAWFENIPGKVGTLRTNYLSYEGAAVQPRCRLSRSYSLIPEQPFMVVRYDLLNITSSELTFSILDQLHLVSAGPNPPIHGSYDKKRNALLAEIHHLGTITVALGAFDAMDGHQVGG